MAFESHHLSLEEQWFCREHPYDLRVVRIRESIKGLDIAEADVARRRTRLDTLVKQLNQKMEETKEGTPVVTTTPQRRRIRGHA